MGKLGNWFRRLFRYSPFHQPHQLPESALPKTPPERGEPEGPQRLSAHSELIGEDLPRMHWQELGRHLQAKDCTGRRKRAVYLGVDFGTALTKVAVRIADYVFFIPWHELTGTGGYLLPGRLSTTNSGASIPGIGQFQALKEPFLPGNDASEGDQVRAVEFLSAVMRFARAWLFKNQPSLLRHHSLAWNLRIGCPTNLFEADDSKDLYRKLAAVAWVASQSESLASGEDVRRVLRVGVAETDTGLDDLEAVPEFVAQITSYSHSPQRADGLHLLVDCGAGTVDVVSFNVFRHPEYFEDRYPIWWSEVKPIGTHFLMEAYLGGDMSRWDTDAPVPDQAKLRDCFGVEQAKLFQVERSFQSDLSQVVCNVLRRTKHSTRYPTAPEWQLGLPVFVCGGGSACRVYLDSVSTGCRRTPVTPLLRSFPLPEVLPQRDISSELFSRLSVAYGLTFDSGRIFPARENEDFPSPTPAPPRPRPDRDDLYPK